MTPSPARASVPVMIVGGVLVAAAGAIAIVERVRDARRDRSAAPLGTAQVGARLPIALWPSTGTEPIVVHGLGGWRELSAAIHHRDTAVDDAARARAIVIAEYSRREQDARRELALEAHVLRGAYEPALIAVAWLHPLRGIRASDLRAFGLSGETLDALDAIAQFDLAPDLVLAGRRELGLDTVSPEVTPEIVAATPPEQRGMLWAVTLDLARERVSARHPLKNTSRG